MKKLEGQIGLFFLFLSSVLFIIVFIWEEGFINHLIDKFNWEIVANCEEKPPVAVSKTLKERGFSDLFTGLGALFTFLAFWWQFKANKRQDKAQELQSKIYSEEKMEQFFIALLSLIKENTNELELCPEISKKRAFHFMYYEFTCIFRICKEVCESNVKWKGYRDKCFTCAYCIFFNGIYNSDESKPILVQNTLIHMTLSKNGYDDEFIKTVLLKLLVIQKAKGEGYSNLFFINQYKCYCEQIKFFDGHRCSLTHITRTVIETIKYIESQEYLRMKKDYYYRLIASLMSDHEIFINVLHFVYLYTNRQLVEIDSVIIDGYNSIISNLDEYMKNKLLSEKDGIGILDLNWMLKI